MKPYGIFYGIGVGPGDPSMLTLRAVELLQKVDVIFEAVGKNSEKSISSTIVHSLNTEQAQKIPLIFSMSPHHDERKKKWEENARLVAKELEAGKNVAFVTIGDPLIYSTFTYLMKEVLHLLPELTIETVPGITSFQYSCSRINKPIVEDEESLLLVPAWKEEIVDEEMMRKADTIVCLKTYRSRNSIIDALQEAGKTDMLYAQRVGLDNEKISTSLSEVKDSPHEYLSHIIAKK